MGDGSPGRRHIVGAMRIRQAESGDLPSIAAIFRQVVAEGESYSFLDDLTDDQIAHAWFATPPGHTIIAVDGEHVLATATTGPDRPGRGDHVGTAGFMVDPRARPAGWARHWPNG